MSSIVRFAALGLLATFTLSAVPTSSFAQTFTFSHLAGSEGGAGHIDAAGTAARFYEPFGLAVDGAGNIYVADTENHVIRKITSGVVTTFAGAAGLPGATDGAGGVARFRRPRGVAVDASGSVYVADTENSTIRKITTDGVVSTIAGLARSSGSADGTGTVARFRSPEGVTVDGAGVIYVADTGNHSIRKVTAAAEVTTWAGLSGTSGSANGTGSAARFFNPCGITALPDGTLYVADRSNNSIRKIAAGAVVSTLAGLAGAAGSANGTGSAARFNYPQGVAVDAGGTVYVADSTNNMLRKVTAAGVVTTLAGLPGTEGVGSADGTGSAVRFNSPSGVTVSPTGALYIADQRNHTIRQATVTGVVTTIAGLAAASGAADGTGGAARFSYPFGVTIDNVGSVYVADTGNSVIRRVTVGGVVTTLAGSPGLSGWKDGTGSAARFRSPQGVAVDASRTVYVADTGSHVVRKITPEGVVTTLAGLDSSSGSSDGTGSAARFYWPRAVAADAGGTVYVADTYNHAVRKVSPEGVVTTLAGSAATPGSADGVGSGARFYWPEGVAVAADGTIFVVDTHNHTVRKVTPQGVVTTLAGLAGASGSTDGTGSAARFAYPSGVAVDGAGVLYVADHLNHTVRRLSPEGVVTTIGGRAGVPGATDGTTTARFSGPEDVAVDALGSVYIADADNHSIRKGVPDTVHLRILKVGTGTGSVVGSSGGLDCGSSCVAAFAPCAQVTLTASPTGGAAFTGWVGADCAGTGPCAVAVQGPMTVAATFDAPLPAPTLTSILPVQGRVSGGTPARLTGTFFVPGATVTVGGAAATNVVVVGATSIAVLTPPGTLGPAAVSVTTPGGTATLPGAFTYVLAPTFTDASLQQGVTPVRAVHVTELRQRVDELRARYGLPGAAWTDEALVTGQTQVKALHITELRTALNAVFTAAGLPVPTYSSPALVAGQTPILAVHITELRSAALAIW